MKLFVDTNIFLEYLLKREHFEEVENFFYLATVNNNQTCVSAMSLRDIGYVVHRRQHSEEAARKAQALIYSLVSKVVSTSADAAIEGIYGDIKDYEDSLQAIAAKEAMCDAIITFNKDDYQNANLPVFTPKEICDIWANDTNNK